MQFLIKALIFFVFKYIITSDEEYEQRIVVRMSSAGSAMLS